MAIKNKDGSTFRLRGPNLLMIHQQDWNKSKVKYINMGNWKDDVVEDKNTPENVVAIKEPEVKSAPVTARQFLEELRAHEPPKEPKPEPKPEPPKEQELNTELKKLFDRKGYKYFCAPAVGKNTYVDDSGNTHQTIQYGEKYLFDVLIISQNDLELVLWCVRQATVSSIIYCKAKDEGERWWRIRSVEPKNGGYVICAFPSEVSPDFS